MPTCEIMNDAVILNGKETLCVQYCAKVMQTIIDEYRDISAIFNKILP